MSTRFEVYLASTLSDECNSYNYRHVEIYNLSWSIDIYKKSGLTSQENVKTLKYAQDCIVFGQ